MPATKSTTPYPLSTKDGTAIPHEVALPQALLQKAVLENQVNSITGMSPHYQFITIESTVDCLLDFRESPAALADNVEALGVVYIPKDTLLVISIDGIPGASYSRMALHSAFARGVAYIQGMSSWGALGEDLQRRSL